MLSPDFSQPDAPRRRRRRSGVVALRQDRPHRDDAEQGRRVSPFRLERLLLGAVAAVRPRLPRAPLPDHPGHALVADLRDRHQAAIRPRRRSTRSSSPRRSSARPAIRARTRSIADRRASTSPPSAAAARTAPTARPASSSWTARPSTCIGRWEIDRGPQDKHYDFWWNLPRDYMVSSEWALPPQFENGIVPEDLLSNKYGHRLHFWDLRARTQRPDHRPRRQPPDGAGGPAGPRPDQGIRFRRRRRRHHQPRGLDLDLVARGRQVPCEKTAIIPPEPADKDQLPPLLQGFGAVPPLVTDIDLSLDDRFLYVSCWGTGEMRQYDVSDPRKPEARRLGPHRRHRPTDAAPERQGTSAAGRRWSRSAATASASTGPIRSIRPGTTSSIPDGVPGAMVKADVGADGGIDARQGFLGRVPQGLPVPPDPARGRRLLDRLLLLSVRLTVDGTRLDHGRPLAGRRRERLVSTASTRHGLAAGRLRRPDGPRPARRAGGARRRSRPGTCSRCSSILLPFAVMPRSLDWQREIRIGAARRSSSPSASSASSTGATRARSPASGRRSSRSGPSRSPLAHGAGLMLLPIYLGICGLDDPDAGHRRLGRARRPATSRPQVSSPSPTPSR